MAGLLLQSSREGKVKYTQDHSMLEQTSHCVFAYVRAEGLTDG